MIKGLQLTDRDVALIHDCYRSMQLSFSQVRRRHFPKNAETTIYNRIQQLKRAGYLQSRQVGILMPEGETGVVYRPTSLALRELQKRFPMEHIREKPMPLNGTRLVHDLTLTDALSALRERYSVQILGDHLIRKDEMTAIKRVPDAFVFDGGKPVAAIELELTAKSHRRYREIILQYRLSSQFGKVLYVVGNEAIATKIRTQVLGNPPRRGFTLPTGKFYFCDLKKLLDDPLGVTISNGTNETFIIEGGKK